jgi:hypothetical protein
MKGGTAVNVNKLFMVVTLIVLSSGCSKSMISPTQGPVTPFAPLPTAINQSTLDSAKPGVPLQIDLVFSSSPDLGRQVDLTFRVTPLLAAPNTTVCFSLPEGFRLIKGDLVWEGDLAQGKSRDFTLTVEAVRIGVWTIKAEASSNQAGGLGFGKSTEVYVLVTEKGAQVSEVPFSPQVEPSALTPKPIAPQNKPSPPLEAQLYFEQTPLLGQSSTLVLAVTSLVDSPHTNITFILPTGFNLIDGSLSRTDNLALGETRRFELTVQAVKTGEWEIIANVISSPAPGLQFGVPVSLYVTLSDSTVAVSAVPKPSPYTTQHTVVDLKIESVPLNDMKLPDKQYQNMGTDGTIGIMGTLTVYGYWYYKDKGGVSRPLRDARVEIWDSCLWGACDTKLATAYTNNSGYYTASGISNSDEGGTRDIYVKVFSTDDYSVRVTDFTVIPILHWAQTPTTNDVADGSFYAGSYAINSESHGNAFYIYDKIANDAFDFLQSNVGWINNYNLQVRWTNSNTSDGTHYHHGGSVDLLAGDGWDEDVFLHEYSHFVMDKTYSSMPSTPNCNPHYWGIHSSTGCAWVEGWANFLQGAIQGSPNYIDTDDAYLNYSLEAPSPWATHPEDEGATGASLWDIFDAATESHDALSNGLNGSSSNGIWRIVYYYDPNVIQEFWNSWGSAGNGYCPQVWSIMNYVSINYDSSAPGTPGGLSSSSHSLGVWSRDNTIDTTWFTPSDGCGSGVSGYSYIWDTSSGTIPDTWPETSSNNTTSSPLADSNSWYFHIRARDAAGNAGPSSHIGPFYIDVTPPGTPSNVWSPSHSRWSWSSDRTIDVNWSGANDNASGVNGYSLEWSQSSNTVPDTSVDTMSTSATSSPLGDGNNWYVHIRVHDTAGNWSSNAAHYGPFYVDGVAPSGSLTVAGGAAYVNSTSVALTLSASDAGSGVSQMQFSNEGASWSNWEAYATSKSWTLSSGDGQKRVYVRYRDNAGNISSSYSDTIILDTAPTNVQASDGTYTDKVQVTWNVSSEATSYQVYQAASEGSSKTLLGSVSNTTYEDTTAIVGITYYYWVKACNSYGCSGYSSHDTGWRNGPSTGTIVINEVNVGNPRWIEFYNRGGQALSMAGWHCIAYSSSGAIYGDYTFADFTLQPGAYVVLHEGNGTDTATDLYINYNIGWVSGGSGAVALTNGSSGSDFVRFGDSLVVPPSGTGWTGTAPAGPPSGQTLGRNSLSIDTDDVSDWCAQAPSIGVQNVGCGNQENIYLPIIIKSQ